jgi:hypothetical protein
MPPGARPIGSVPLPHMPLPPNTGHGQGPTGVTQQVRVPLPPGANPPGRIPLPPGVAVAPAPRVANLGVTFDPVSGQVRVGPLVQPAAPPAVAAKPDAPPPVAAPSPKATYEQGLRLGNLFVVCDLVYYPISDQRTLILG